MRARPVYELNGAIHRSLVPVQALGIGLDAKDFTNATIKPRPALGHIVQLG